MATTNLKYRSLHRFLIQDLMNLETVSLKIALLNNHTFNYNHTAFTQVSGDETSGTGYTAGGQAIATSRVGNYLDAVDNTWVALTCVFDSAVVYVDGTIDGQIDSPLLYMDMGQEYNLTAEDFTFVWGGNGIFQLQNDLTP